MTVEAGIVRLQRNSAAKPLLGLIELAQIRQSYGLQK
jgi:hypothetical protein